MDRYSIKAIKIQFKVFSLEEEMTNTAVIRLLLLSELKLYLTEITQ
jgi:hypothetical protein